MYNIPSYWPVLAQALVHTPPWLSTKIEVDLSLQNLHHDPVSQFTELLEHNQDTQFLYTNGSTKAELESCEVASNMQIIQQRILPSYFSMFSTELKAILLAMQHITRIPYNTGRCAWTRYQRYKQSPQPGNLIIPL